MRWKSAERATAMLAALLGPDADDDLVRAKVLVGVLGDEPDGTGGQALAAVGGADGVGGFGVRPAGAAAVGPVGKSRISPQGVCPSVVMAS